MKKLKFQIFVNCFIQKVFLTCDDGQTQSLQYDVDIPFINSKHGVVFGLDCANDKGKRFSGDLSQVILKLKN